MMKLWTVMFLMGGMYHINAQQFSSDTGTTYEYATRDIKSSIVIFSDSTYTYRLWTHVGPAIIDSGKWKLRCDMLILNSRVSFSKETRLNKKRNANEPVPYPIFFRNSCFLRKDAELIREVVNGENWVYKMVNH